MVRALFVTASGVAPRPGTVPWAPVPPTLSAAMVGGATAAGAGGALLNPTTLRAHAARESREVLVDSGRERGGMASMVAARAVAWRDEARSIGSGARGS